MPPRRKNARPSHLHPQAGQSDYDTDTANLTDSGPAVPPPPVRSNVELNMMVLRRWCPGVERILAIAPFAVLYLFSSDSQQWEKLDMQGTLFVCELAGEVCPQYRVLILNRKSLDNFSLELVSTDDIQITEEFIIVQVLGEDHTPLIYGIWIFSDADAVPNTREQIAATLQDCAALAESHYEALGAPATQDMDYGRAAKEFEQALNQHELHFDQALNRQELQYQQPVTSAPTGQQIDLATLFRATQTNTQQASHIPQAPPSQSHNVQGRFANTADTDFFRSSPAPANMQQPFSGQHQQNALLNLFKGAKGGYSG